MSETGIRPGALVRHGRGVGKVVSAGSTEVASELLETAEIEFWGSDSSRVLQRSIAPLPGDSPEALLWEDPAAIARWAEDAPLKLIAAALSVGGGSGKVADIREKLDGRIPGMKWEGWWKKAPPMMRKLPEHFSITRVGKDSEYRLLTSVDAVPSTGEDSTGSSDSGATTVAEWRKWLQTPTHEPAPGRFPTRQVAGSLAKWPEKDIEQVLLRLIVTVEGALAEGAVSAQAADGWLRAVAQGTIRLRETGGQDTRGYMAARAGTILAQLARIAGDRTPQDLLLQAGALDGDTDAWRRGFLAGMWDAFEGEDAREMYRMASSALGRQARGDLARQIVLAAFGPEMSDRRHSELDRLLDALPEAERLHILEEVIARATTGQRAEVLDYIESSRHSEGDERLPLRMVAVLMLSQGQGKLAARTSWELAESLAAPSTYGPEVAALYENTAARIQAIMAFNAGNLEELKEAHEARIEQERQDQERLRQQVRERNAELAANREESRLEVRQDMLLAIGEVLQSVNDSDAPGELAASVQAGLNLALRAGGAEPLESPGERAEYDPEIHFLVNENNKNENNENEDSGGLAKSSPVTVVAPGVIVRGETNGDRVLLKAQVRHEAGQWNS